jgi:hypothetical protein
MSENETKHESKSCCCCQSWKAIFIAIAFMAIGAFLGHKMTMMHHCGQMMFMNHPCCSMMRGACGGGYGMERQCGFEHKGRFEHKFDTGKCKPGCTCPICSKKAAGLSDPNKATCPMMEKK